MRGRHQRRRRSSPGTRWLSSATGETGHDAKANSVDWEAQMEERDVPNGWRGCWSGRVVESCQASFVIIWGHSGDSPGRRQQRIGRMHKNTARQRVATMGHKALGCEDEQAESRLRTQRSSVAMVLARAARLDQRRQRTDRRCRLALDVKISKSGWMRHWEAISASKNHSASWHHPRPEQSGSWLDSAPCRFISHSKLHRQQRPAALGPSGPSPPPPVTTLTRPPFEQQSIVSPRTAQRFFPDLIHDRHGASRRFDAR